MKTLSVAKRLIKQITGDKRTIVLLLFAPLLVIYLLSVIFTSSSTKAKFDVLSAPEHFLSILSEEADVTLIDDEEEALQRLKDKKSDAYILYAENKMTVTVEGADPTRTKLVMGALNKTNTKNLTDVMKSMAPYEQQGQTGMQLDIKYLYGSEDLGTFDILAPMMMGFFIFFFVFLIAGISFLRERISGTLDRILATPLRRSEIVLGYFLGFGLFIALQTLLIQAFMLYVLHVEMAGAFGDVLLINLVLAGGSLALGTLLSAFAANEFQLFQFIPLVIVPQILFSGIFDLSEAPQWVTVLSKIFPMTYGAEALRNVMLRGYGFNDILPDLAVLAAYMLLFLFLNIIALKKYRRI